MSSAKAKKSGFGEIKKSLLIVESPAKCGKFEQFLGAGYKCLASYGHITSLASLKDVDIENNFKPSFKIIDSKRMNINRLRTEIARSGEVILATDDDREGEAIAWHICQQFNLPVATTKRIIFHEITKPAIVAAVQNPTVINMDTVHAAQARQVLDLVVGFRISPMLWNNISRNSAKGLSAGRCQTPALALVYDNYCDIKKAPGRQVYNTTGYFTSLNIPFQLNKNHESKEAMESFLEDSSEHEHIFSKKNERNTTKNPPKPFTTSALQQTANNEMRASPKDTMSMCQKLYEAGFITYMRTDSPVYSKEFIAKAKKYIEGAYGDDYVREDIDSLSENKKSGGKKETKKKTKKEGDKGKEEKKDNAQEAHEAIRPTKVEITEITDDLNDVLSARERKMYKLIWRNTVESCMAPAKYKALTCVVSAAEEAEFRSSQEQVVFPGWKKVAGYTEENKEYALFKTMKNNQLVEYHKIVSKVTLKDIKSHYTEAKLVQLLEEKGIGRPSTFSSLVEKIQERGYVKCENVKGKKLKCYDYELTQEELVENENEREFGNEKNKLVIQNLGVIVIEFLLKHFDALFNYDYTRTMEDRLDVIAKGNAIWHELCRGCYNEISTLSGQSGLVQNKTREERQIHQIDAHHTYMVAKYGPVIKYEKDGKTSFKSVKKDVDYQDIVSGKLSLADILETNADQQKKRGLDLGEIDGEKVYIKEGRYGHYVEVGTKKLSLKEVENVNILTLEDVKKMLADTPKEVVRRINEIASLRKSKYGFYIFYKPPTWNKPKFISLKNFKEDAETCSIEKLEAMLPKAK